MSAAAGEAGTQAELFFGLRDLRRVRQLAARWAELARLSRTGSRTSRSR